MSTSPVSAGSTLPVAKPLPPKIDTRSGSSSPRCEVAELYNSRSCGASRSGRFDHHHA